MVWLWIWYWFGRARETWRQSTPVIWPPPLHRPAHAPPYRYCDGDVWFTLFTSALTVTALLLGFDTGILDLLSAAFGGAVIGALLRLAWAAYDQEAALMARDLKTPRRP